MPTPSPYIFGNFDVAEFCLIAFFVFFLGLVFYLRREDRREGYPLEDDVTGRLEPLGGLLFMAPPKTFRLPHGHGERHYPNGSRDTRRLAARRSAPMDGAPLEPVGDPLSAGVGPGAWTERPRYPDRTREGHPKIVPLRVDHEMHLAAADPDPRGMTVLGADGREAGVVSDVWVDRSELLIRYLEVSVPAAGMTSGRRVLAPMTMAVINGGRRQVVVRALRADQFAGAPALESPDQITLYEEERVMAYFGAGYLYATPDRQEPWI